MTRLCELCHKRVNLDDRDLHEMVSGWVGGPKKDSMKLRKSLGIYAHGKCIRRVNKGVSPTQKDLFEQQDSEYTGGEVPDLADLIFGGD